MRMPNLVRVRQCFSTDYIKDIDAYITSQFSNFELKYKIKSGDKIAITAGSRGIKNLSEIIKSIGAIVRKLGGEPFVVTAMGSHGGATERGQLEILESLSITEEVVSMPIKAGLDVIKIGETKQGIDVYMDKIAFEADGIIAVNRVRPHSPAFRIGSGCQKILAIGLGNQKGCSTLHKNTEGDELYELIIEVASIMVSKANVFLGVGIVENANGNPVLIEFMQPNKFYEKEQVLIKRARELLPKIPFDNIDVLVVDYVGKNLASAGIDTSIIGNKRPNSPDRLPKIRRLVALDLTLESHGNGIGIGLADFTTRKFVGKIDFDKTYMNAISSCEASAAKIPIVLDNDKKAIEVALETIGKKSIEVRLIRIPNTRQLEELLVSPAYLDDIKHLSDLEIISEPKEIIFNDKGNITPFKIS